MIIVNLTPPKWKKLPENLPRTGYNWNHVEDFAATDSGAVVLGGHQDGEDIESTHDHGRICFGRRQCDFCGTWIRFGHYITHRQWPNVLIAGKTCASYLAAVDAEELEKRFISEQQERAREEARRAAEQQEREAAELRRLEREAFWREQEAEAQRWQEIQRQEAEELERRRQEQIQQAVATRPERVKEIKQAIWHEVCEIGKTWYQGWRETAKGISRNIDGYYFSASCTIFRGPDDVPFEDRSFKYVLNLPKLKIPKWAPRWYDTLKETHEAAHLAFKKHMEGLIFHTPLVTFIPPCWTVYIETGIRP